jgi:flagellar biosynthesis/type III secretory pathway protein FliH
MSAAAFLPDPLLSRVAKSSGADGFDVETLLSPVQARFARDRLLTPWEEPVDSVLPLGLTAADAAEAHTIDHGRDDSVSDEVLDPSSYAAEGSAMHPSSEEMSLSPELQAFVERRYREGFEEGIAEGTRLALDESGDALKHEPAAGSDVGAASAFASRDTVLLLESLSRALQPLLLPDDAATRFEPLKRLALHLATELVRSELTVSPQVVDQLVRRSVHALQAGDKAPLTVDLNPEDLTLLKAAWGDPVTGLPVDSPLLNRVAWREDMELSRGSVRVGSDASTVEDLIEHRLASIMRELRIHASKWQADELRLQSQFAPMSAAAAEPTEQPAQASDPDTPGDTGAADA